MDRRRETHRRAPSGNSVHPGDQGQRASNNQSNNHTRKKSELADSKRVSQQPMKVSPETLAFFLKQMGYRPQGHFLNEEAMPSKEDCVHLTRGNMLPIWIELLNRATPISEVETLSFGMSSKNTVDDDVQILKDRIRALTLENNGLLKDLKEIRVNIQEKERFNANVVEISMRVKEILCLAQDSLSKLSNSKMLLQHFIKFREESLQTSSVFTKNSMKACDTLKSVLDEDPRWIDFDNGGELEEDFLNDLRNQMDKCGDSDVSDCLNSPVSHLIASMSEVTAKATSALRDSICTSKSHDRSVKEAIEEALHGIRLAHVSQIVDREAMLNQQVDDMNEIARELSKIEKTEDMHAISKFAKLNGLLKSHEILVESLERCKQEKAKLENEKKDLESQRLEIFRNVEALQVTHRLCCALIDRSKYLAGSLSEKYLGSVSTLTFKSFLEIQKEMNRFAEYLSDIPQRVDSLTTLDLENSRSVQEDEDPNQLINRMIEFTNLQYARSLVKERNDILQDALMDASDLAEGAQESLARSQKMHENKIESNLARIHRLDMAMDGILPEVEVIEKIQVAIENYTQHQVNETLET